ncbi:MAG TPA: hypothetical protein VFO77_05665, partial [Actinoplanes sp.]|nr:hypothetical protein [Actinoplanes sp.]
MHPLAALLARWRGQGGVRHVHLADLPGSGVGAMVAEMLHLGTAAATGLARLIAPYTAGNPYETVELLNTLRQGGVLTATAGGWRWDATAVAGYLDASDPARLLAGRVAALPEPSRRIVEAMACLGGRAELDLLVTAAGAPAGEVEQRLDPVLVEGLLVAEPGAVRFRHDRIREAVLAEVAPPQRRELHLAIARRLAGVPELFAVAAEQYLPVVDAVTDSAERRQVVTLLRRAAEQAALIGEHTLVSKLLAAAVLLVDPGETRTLLAVRSVLHAALFSAGLLEAADEQYKAIMELSPTTIELADATAVQVSSLTHRNRYAEALALGVGSLRELGVTMPDPDRFNEYLDRQFERLHRWLDETDTADELARPEISDPALLATARLISPSLSAAFFGGDVNAGAWLGLAAMRIWLEHGPAPTLVGPACNANYAAMALRDDYATSYRTARRMLALGEARHYEPGTSQVRHLFTTVVFWFEPIEEGVRSGRRAREGLIAGGNLAWAAYTFHQTVGCLLECAPSLDTLAAEVRAGLAFTGRTGNEQTSEMLDSYLWLVGALRGDGSAAETIPVDRLAGNQLALFHAHVTRAAAAAVFGDAAGLELHTAAAQELLPAAFGQYTTAVARLLRGLALTEQARTKHGDPNRLLAELDELIEWLAARAVDAPANFSHLVRLLEAERAWAVGDFPAAARAFDAALREVARRRRPWHHALIAEH